MIVYVETNFILELAFEQEQHQAANSILTLAEQGKIDLALPGFSISESFQHIKTELRSYNCTYIQEFEDGLGYIESELRKAE